MIPIEKIQEIYCDGTAAQLPDKPFFSYKSTFHTALDKGRVHVDFSLHVVNKPSQNLGIWRCRVNFRVSENHITYDAGFEYYKTGFRVALAGAEKFVELKYGIRQILAPQSDSLLLERYAGLMEAKRNS